MFKPESAYVVQHCACGFDIEFVYPDKVLLNRFNENVDATL